MIFKARGFTLIELLATLTIISILGVLAIPQYQKYVLRARVNTVIAQAAPALSYLSNYYVDNDGNFANQTGGKDYSQLNGGDINYVRAVYGTVHIETYIPNPDNSNTNINIGIAPVYEQADANGKGILRWQCRSNAANWPYLPKSCQNACQQPNDYSNCSCNSGCYTDSSSSTAAVSYGTYTKCIYAPPPSYCGYTYSYCCYNCTVPTTARGWDCT